MSTQVSDPVSTPAQPRGADPASAVAQPVTFGRVLQAEWIKFWSLRSSWLMLLAAVAGVIVIGQLIGYNTGKSWSGLAPEDSAPSGVMQGYYLGQLLLGVLGVLFVSGEYGTGAIRSTLAAVPTRLPVLAAKSLLQAAIVLVAMVPTCVVAFLGAMAFRAHFGHGVSLSGNLRVVLGTAVYLTLVAVLGGAVGWIVRSTPGGISTLVGLLLVAPVLLMVIPGDWAKNLAQYLPSNAGSAFVSSIRAPHTLAPWPGLLVMVVWVVVALVAAAVTLRRRDA